MIKESINKRGLKFKWVAEQINVNYASLRVYLNNENLMPEDVRKAIKDLLK